MSNMSKLDELRDDVNHYSILCDMAKNKADIAYFNKKLDDAIAAYREALAYGGFHGDFAPRDW